MSWGRIAAGITTAGLLTGAATVLGPTAVGGSPTQDDNPPVGSAGPVAPLGSSGSRLVDAEGRVVLLHGVNEVYKRDPFYPAADDFGAADAVFLAEHGFNAVRLGVQFQALMPEPGEIDHDYIENLAVSVDDLADEGIFVLLDFHQDGYGPEYTGNGFPRWMSLDDDEWNNPDARFPAYYVENPAMQRAFENFWANREGPDGVGLQDHFVDGLTAVVARFADDTQVIGYELMNEPWPGHVWEPCIAPVGCFDIEQEKLIPFHEKATAAIREITDTQQVWVEPFVLFNFGQGPTSIPGQGSDNVLSWHSYALDVAGEEAVVEHARHAAARDGVPAVATEFGATLDPDEVNRLLDQIEGGLMGWMFWAYNEQVVGYGSRRDDSPRIEQVRSLDLFTALVRPYPTALTGTPTASDFDADTLTYRFTYDTAGPGGETYRDGLESVFSVPALRYPDGYQVEVNGATVASDPDATVMTLVNDNRADEVTVCVYPADVRPDDVDCEPPAGPGDPDPGPSDRSPAPAPPAPPVTGRPQFTG